jgi:hypothetical protein
VQQQSFASFLFALFCYHKRQMRWHAWFCIILNRNTSDLYPHANIWHYKDLAM